MIKLPIEIGDTILTGKFRNHRTVVETIETDEWGHPTVNGKPILKVRIEKLMQDKKESSMNRLERLLEKKNEEQDDNISKVADIIKTGVSLMSMRSHLEKIFPKKDIDFAMGDGMPAHFRIKTKKGTLIIASKNVVDDPELVVGALAIGYDN